jgi:hypothetical protein
MKKCSLVIATLVSLVLVGSVFASPASAFFFGGSGNQNCGQSYSAPGGGTPGFGLPGFRGLGFGPRGVGGPGGGTPGFGLPGFRGLGFGPRGVGGPGFGARGAGAYGFGGPGAGYCDTAYCPPPCNPFPAACKRMKKGKKAKAKKK